MLAQEVNAKFLAGLCEAEQRIEGENVCENTTTFVPVYQIQKFECALLAWFGEGAIFSGAIEVVHTSVLVVETLGKDPACDARGSEHELHERFEFDVAVI